MQLRMPFRPSDRRKPRKREHFDKDMILIQCVSRDVIAFQVVQVDMASRRDRLFRRANRDSALVDLFACLDLASGHFVTDCNVLREPYLTSSHQILVSRPDGPDHDEDIVIAMDAQQLGRFPFALHQNFPYLRYASTGSTPCRMALRT